MCTAGANPAWITVIPVAQQVVEPFFTEQCKQLSSGRCPPGYGDVGYSSSPFEGIPPAWHAEGGGSKVTRNLEAPPRLT